MAPLMAWATSGGRSPGPGQIVWLASYPKSGNTWLRSLVTAYQQGPGQALNINALGGFGAASRSALDELLGLASADLSRDELRRLLPNAYRGWSAMPGGPHFLKVHDACAIDARGQALFPQDATRCVIHIVRDPRDVAVSAMHHWGLTQDETIARMNNPEQWVAAKPDNSANVPQCLSDWSGHARSWLDGPLPRVTLRYEDILADPAGQFRRVLDWLEQGVDEARLAHAVVSCALDRLQAQERDKGFAERPGASQAPFFRAGRAGGWRSALTAAQCDCIVQAHAAMMQHLGYAR